MTASPAQIYLLRRHASKKTAAADAEGRLNSNGTTCSYLRIHVTGSKGTGGLEPPARQGRASLPVRLSQAQGRQRGEAPAASLARGRQTPRRTLPHRQLLALQVTAGAPLGCRQGGGGSFISRVPFQDKGAATTHLQ